MTTNINAALKMDLWDFADLSLKLRFAQAMSDGATRYPIHRVLRFAARIELEQFFDALALSKAESAKLLTALVENDALVRSTAKVLEAKGKNSYSLADIYSAIKNSRHPGQ